MNAMMPPDFKPARIKVRTSWSGRTQPFDGFIHGAFHLANRGDLLRDAWIIVHVATGLKVNARPFEDRARAIAALREINRIRNDWPTIDEIALLGIKEVVSEILERHGASLGRGTSDHDAERAGFFAAPLNGARL